MERALAARAEAAEGEAAARRRVAGAVAALAREVEAVVAAEASGDVPVVRWSPAEEAVSVRVRVSVAGSGKARVEVVEGDVRGSGKRARTAAWEGRGKRSVPVELQGAWMDLVEGLVAVRVRVGPLAPHASPISSVRVFVLLRGVPTSGECRSVVADMLPNQAAHEIEAWCGPTRRNGPVTDAAHVYVAWTASNGSPRSAFAGHVSLTRGLHTHAGAHTQTVQLWGDASLAPPDWVALAGSSASFVDSSSSNSSNNNITRVSARTPLALRSLVPATAAPDWTRLLPLANSLVASLETGDEGDERADAAAAALMRAMMAGD